MSLTALTVHLIAGASATLPRTSAVTWTWVHGNTIVGTGEGAGGQILFALSGLSGTVQIVSASLTGGAGGGPTSLLTGFLKSKMYA